VSEQRREWKTEQEIIGIVHQEMRDALKDQNLILNRFGVSLDKIADAAQAQMASSIILHGDPRLGIKGAIPDLLERVGKLEESVEGLGDSDVKHEARIVAMHTQNTARFDTLEANQYRISRSIKKVAGALFMNPDGVDYKRIAALFTAIGIAVHYLFSYLSWTHIKLVVSKIRIWH
jgi:hypothetical protein